MILVCMMCLLHVWKLLWINEGGCVFPRMWDYVHVCNFFCDIKSALIKIKNKGLNTNYAHF